jgi:hypothetical protein
MCSLFRVIYSTKLNQISNVYRLLRPDVIEGRLPGRRRKRVNYISLGPNDMWHVDGHVKLEPFGIEIYAAIDGYSRFLVWIYVGISARTVVSVLRQSLDAFTSMGFQPRKIRSDRGTETTLMADTQYELRRLQDPSLRPSDCYIYGRSVDNQRIEAWWGMLSRTCTGLFHVNEVIHLFNRANKYRNISIASSAKTSLQKTAFPSRSPSSRSMCLLFDAESIHI